MRGIKTSILAILLVAIAAPAQENPQKPGGIAKPGAKGTVQVKIEEGLELRQFLDQISRAIGKPLIFDPNGQRIRGQKIGMTFEREVPKDRVLDTFRSILAFYELTLVPVGPRGYDSYLVIDSRSTNNFVKNKALFVPFDELPRYRDRDGVYISTAIPAPNIENLTTLRVALSTMVSPAGIGRVHEVPGTQTIIVMDFAPTVAAVADLVGQASLAAQEHREVLESFELKHAGCREAAAALTALLQKPPAPPVQRGSPYVRPVAPRIVPYEPRNALLVSASGKDVKRIRELLSTIDRPAKRPVMTER